MLMALLMVHGSMVQACVRVGSFSTFAMIGRDLGPRLPVVVCCRLFVFFIYFSCARSFGVACFTFRCECAYMCSIHAALEFTSVIVGWLGWSAAVSSCASVCIMPIDMNAFMRKEQHTVQYTLKMPKSSGCSRLSHCLERGAAMHCSSHWSTHTNHKEWKTSFYWRYNNNTWKQTIKEKKYGPSACEDCIKWLCIYLAITSNYCSVQEIEWLFSYRLSNWSYVSTCKSTLHASNT